MKTKKKVWEQRRTEGIYDRLRRIRLETLIMSKLPSSDVAQKLLLKANASKSSFQRCKVKELEVLCGLYGLKVSQTGKRGRIKSDFVNAIWEFVS